jgi:phosphoesterase RecJ-like protein
VTGSEAFAAVAERLRGADRVLLASHVHPDGDALGSLVAMRLVLTRLGKSVELFLASEDLPLPEELDTFELGPVVHDPLASFEDRLIVFLDCGNSDRSPLGQIASRPDLQILNIDHHHDNTCFGQINWIDPDASCTAEMVWRLSREFGIELDTELAEPLYLGLVTDTGRFSYESTTPGAHLMAAAMISAGVDVADVRRRLYEDMPPEKLGLLRHALDNTTSYGGGLLVSARITSEDFRVTGASEHHTEGIIDILRCVRGARIAMLARELDASPGVFKVSVRAVDPSIDVSAIARADGGGGHPQAAGFTTQRSDDELAAFVLEQLAAQDRAGATLG